MEHSPYKNVRQFILASMIVVPLIPFFLALWVGNHSFSHSIQKSTIDTLKRISEDHRQMIESFLQERTNDLQLIFNTVDVVHLSQPQTLSTVFHQLQSTSSAFVDLGIFDDSGIHKVYHGPYDLSGKVYKDTPWFQQTLDNGVYISDVFTGYRNIPHFVIAVAKKAEERTWIIRATVDSKRFNDLVRQIRIGKTGEAYLINREGVLQTDRRSGGNLMETPSETFPLPPDDIRVHTFVHRHSGGIPFLYAATWLKDGSWLLVVRQEESDAFSALRSARMPILFISMIGIGCILAVAFGLTGAIIRKMEKTDSEKALLNQQLIGASRLAEIGEMSTGFAHEINNPLQIMSTELSLVNVIHQEMIEAGEMKTGEPYAQVADSLCQIKTQIGRCSRITASILKFGRQAESRSENLDLTKSIPDIVSMVEKKAEVNGIQLENECPASPIWVTADAARLQQVLLNLINNAMDAVTEQYGNTGGAIRVCLSSGNNGSATIQVRDNGIGIAPENMEKVFSPFFTTKPVGKGTGLGLSVCYGIVRQMGGDMHVESEVGNGTTFTICLPLDCLTRE